VENQISQDALSYIHQQELLGKLVDVVILKHNHRQQELPIKTSSEAFYDSTFVPIKGPIVFRSPSLLIDKFENSRESEKKILEAEYKTFDDFKEGFLKNELPVDVPDDWRVNLERLLAS